MKPRKAARRKIALMNDSMAVAASAMRTAENRVNAAAQQIVRAVSTPATGAPQPPAAPTADLVEGMIDLKQSELAFREGITVFKAADQMTRRALDILT